MFGWPRKISVREASRLIGSRGLRPASATWHYSLDIERFYDHAVAQDVGGRLYVSAPRPLNEWSPLAVFTDHDGPTELKTMKPDCPPFWVLKLTSLDDFLARRSAASRSPGTNFPSKQTYPSVSRRLNCRLEKFPLSGNEARFALWYGRLKHPKYQHTGEACIDDAKQHNPGVPDDWFIVTALIDNATGDCRAAQLSIEDERSHSSINVASERRSRASYGTLLDVEMIRDLCSRGMQSFDCGVSGDYGGYKRRVFLDALPTTALRTQETRKSPLSRLFR